MDETKKIILLSADKNEQTKKNIKCEKERRMRVETATWGLGETELSHETQLNVLINIESERNTYVSRIKTHIKHKLGSYKQQDITKKKYDISKFVSFNETIRLLVECGLKCCYCSNEVYILYEHVRENKQWTLDRVNNDIGHNDGNLVISCLECNLKRRRTNKDAFMFTKNMVIIKS